MFLLHLLIALILQMAHAATLNKIGTFDLPGPTGKRFDYLTIDYAHHRLLAAHLGAGNLYVIDLSKNKLLNTISDLAGIEGVEYVPELDKVYTSDWKEQKIGVVDLKTGKVIKKLPAIAKPDGSVYAADFHKMYISDEVGKAEIVVDVNTDTVVKTLNFDSEAGMPQYDPVAKKVYVNLQDKNKIAEIDPKTDKVTASYEVGKCQGNHGMAIDSPNRRLFLSCEGNNLMTVFDLVTHKPVGYRPMADGADVIKYDPGLKRVYVACYSGAVSVFHEVSGNQFEKLGDVAVQPKVHSLAVDASTHKVYAPEQEEDGKPVARMVIYEAR